MVLVASMNKDIAEYVATCPICAQNKKSNKAAAGLLNPLAVPHRPWSHISLDFVSHQHLRDIQSS